ncbi:hypothetical protein BZA05DRAFT_406637 [Tricharina praecox]|uniref:uncharacterized protein n=1 Tax=Tricharina praecox TaxID=43433 RepID=UPI002220E981|nr:uncharacterized protein BZA05DRAFT_406637 [Tricharina praecox]KAI5846792.1 hypothetical protein BZA05DRAFT_406637 [Tricharina praecox]
MHHVCTFVLLTHLHTRIYSIVPARSPSLISSLISSLIPERRNSRSPSDFEPFEYLPIPISTDINTAASRSS